MLFGLCYKAIKLYIRRRHHHHFYDGGEKEKYSFTLSMCVCVSQMVFHYEQKFHLVKKVCTHNVKEEIEKVYLNNLIRSSSSYSSFLI